MSQRYASRQRRPTAWKRECLGDLTNMDKYLMGGCTEGIITSKDHTGARYFTKPTSVLQTHARAMEGKAGTDTPATASFPHYTAVKKEAGAQLWKGQSPTS
ncbi:hypothetical protein QYF61_004832 [Mycteria americana]|uniref:Uncharacterized protein n=1 Tax=Mycteria americana TaxID=33587 RepID=A0AAN7NGT5_MYCAM|nr:hypothetical protein QYF61_004832 [Mycteria americana]